MKAGTTFLHHLLAAREDVFMPRAELFFFDSDEVIGHHAFTFQGAQAEQPFHENTPTDAALGAYRSHFAAARPDQVIGEDTTTYLASHRAPRRIKQLVPDVKLIAVLRNPVDRAYSQYWHQVRSGTCFLSFEKALRYQQGSMLSRGCYFAQLKRYYREFPQAQIHVVAFEDLVEDTASVVQGVCRFIGIDSAQEQPAAAVESNKGEALRFPKTTLLANYLRAALGRGPGTDLGTQAPPAQGLTSLPRSLIKRVLVRKDSDYAPMSPQTRRALAELYRAENGGLDDLVGQDLSLRWFGD